MIINNLIKQIYFLNFTHKEHLTLNYIYIEKMIFNM